MDSTLAYALGLYCVSSIAMMLGNKLAVSSLPLPSCVILIQAFASLLLLLVPPQCRRNVAPFRMSVVVRWAPATLLFASMLFTSMQSFNYATVSTIIVFRNIGAVFATLIEYVVRGVGVNARVIAAEVAIVAGAIMYGRGALDFTWIGLAWILANVFVQTAYGVSLKFLLDKHEDLGKLTKFDMAFYNNLLTIPMLSVPLVLFREHDRFVDQAALVSPIGWVYLGLTCFFGFMLSTSGFGLQKLVSATTFIVINNLAKFVNILLGIVVLNDKVDSPLTIGGCVVGLVAGGWYSYEVSRIQKKSAAAVKPPKPAPFAKRD